MRRTRLIEFGSESRRTGGRSRDRVGNARCQATRGRIISRRSITTASLAAVWLAGCNRHQSALAPFGEEAADTRTLMIVLMVGAVVIAGGVSLLIRHAIRSPGEGMTHERGMKLVLWLGGVVPTVVLLALLVGSLPAMRPIETRPADLRIDVTGEQFWWRVAYRPAGGAAVRSANEVRVPVGRAVAIRLGGGDVIHSFWIPGLAGKMDMIPGRTNTLVVRATSAGRFRGVCTEFCGLSHALMAFDVVAMEPAAFDRWLAGEAGPPRGAVNGLAPGDPVRIGAAAFGARGCGGCHAIRGRADAAGLIGPDLSRFGARATLAAGVLPMTTANVAAFIRHPEATKPGVRMPAFPQVPASEAEAIARYLRGLR